MQDCTQSQVRIAIAPEASVVPAGTSTRSLTGQTFRRLVENLLRVPYRAVRESVARKSATEKEPEQEKQADQPSQTASAPALKSGES